LNSTPGNSKAKAVDRSPKDFPGAQHAKMGSSAAHQRPVTAQSSYKKQQHDSALQSKHSKPLVIGHVEGSGIRQSNQHINVDARQSTGTKK
jgi:hypothetical protein